MLRSLKIHRVGMHHDPLLYACKAAMKNWGHSRGILSVIVRLPFRPEDALNHPAAAETEARVSQFGGSIRFRPVCLA